MRNLFKYRTLLLMFILILLSLPVHAQTNESCDESEAEELILDPIIVTAFRYESRELSTPASVEVLTREDIENIGAPNVIETLKYSLGTNYSTHGPGGAGMAAMTSDINIRGVKNGTLVLVNGRAINNRGLHMLEKFKTDNVERIEMVRGGGAVMYGSDAMGGVINIITKKDSKDSSVYYEMGNYGQVNTGLNASDGSLLLNYSYGRWGSVKNISLSSWQSTVQGDPTGRYFANNFDGSRSQNLSLSYQFNDRLSFFYSYDKLNTFWTYKFTQGTNAGNNLAGKTRYMRDYENRQNVAQLNFNDKKFNVSLYYNDLSLNTNGIDYLTATGAINTNGQTNVWNTSADERNRNLGLDAQYASEVGKGKYLVGVNGQYEYYKKNKSMDSLHRYNYSLYGNIDYSFNKQTTAILAIRYNWQVSNPNPISGNLSKFTPQLQIRQKVGENDYVYVSVGTSYKMPTLAQQFAPAGSNVVGDPTIKPQSGVHYEIGWKRNKGQHGWRVALFNYYIKDNISTKNIGTPGNPIYKFTNEDRKNTGIEIEYKFTGNKGWSYNLGVSIGNPKTKNSELPVPRDNVWERAFDRYQLTSGVTYKKNKWIVNLNLDYLFGRVHNSPSNANYGPEKEKPALYTSLNIRYKVDKRQEFYLTVENLFNRRDIVNNSATEYYATPINFRVGYSFKF